MTVFDIVFLLVILVSALVGYARGAIKELVTLFAFGLAAMAAVLALPFAGKLFRHMVHPPWAGNATAVLVVFVVVYILLRVVGSLLTRHVHSSRLGALDRGAGGVFGVGRALVLAGAFFLVFSRITPPDLSPRWITGGLTWPLARASGNALTVFAPSGMKLADGMTKMMGEGVQRGFNETDDQGIELGGSAPENATDAPTAAPAPARRGLSVTTRETTTHTTRHRTERTDR